MNKVTITPISPDNNRLVEIADLYRKFYEGMNSQGLLLPLVDGGELQWIQSIKTTLGRFNQLYAAIFSDQIIGFAYGTIRFTPPYIGGERVGFVGGLYVLPEYRSKGIGEQLYNHLETWFKTKKTHSFELQVLCGNHSGMKFWEKLGYQRELLQMRKFAL